MAGAVTTAQPESRNRIMIVAAVVFAALAALLLFIALQSRSDGGGGAGAAGTTVVVAAQDIAPNTILTADMLEAKSVASGDALAGVYGTVEGAVGLPARFYIQRGEQVTTAKTGLEAIRDEKDIALVLEPGQRAVAVQAEEVTAVGGLLLPGNRVDVIAYFNEDQGGVRKTVTVLQNIEVVSVAQEAQEPVPAGGAGVEGDAAAGITGQRPDEAERQPAARSITLAVAPHEAQVLALLQSEGARIWLVLRPTDDDDRIDLPEQTLFPFHSPPIPQEVIDEFAAQ